jgi:hypothetical protein
LVVNEIVGFVLVDHTTPLFVMDDPPSDVMFPPALAVVEVISVTSMVVTTGSVLYVILVEPTFPFI